MKTNKQTMTVREALGHAWDMISLANSGYNDKIVLFYNVSPYKECGKTIGEGYIHWKLASKYSARSQFYNPEACGSCWHGNPPEKYFLDCITRECLELRMRMTEKVNSARIKNDYAVELDSMRASDEVDPLDSIFY